MNQQQQHSLEQDLPLFPLLKQTSFLGPDPLALSLQSGLMVTAAVTAAVNLRLADCLGEHAKTIETLALETDTHAPSLYVFLKALAAIEIFSEINARTFINTARSRLLQSDAFADLVRLWG